MPYESQQKVLNKDLLQIFLNFWRRWKLICLNVHYNLVTENYLESSDATTLIRKFITARIMKYKMLRIHSINQSINGDVRQGTGCLAHPLQSPQASLHADPLPLLKHSLQDASICPNHEPHGPRFVRRIELY